MVEHLDDDERQLVEAMRRARGRGDQPLPRLTPEQLRVRLRVRLGLQLSTINETIKKLGRCTTRYPGPRVRLDGTLNDLKTSWRAHHDDMVIRGKSGDAIRHHREAVDRYCRAIELDWTPEPSIYEKRSIAARTKRRALTSLPADWIDQCRALVNDAHYHDDPTFNETIRHSLRFAFFTGPRMPSELCRLRTGDVDLERGTATLRMSKVGGPEGDAVLIPREVWGLAPHVLTWPQRRSWTNWLRHRETLMERARARFGQSYDHDRMLVNIQGEPIRPDYYRNLLARGAKEVWPDFHPYLAREIAFIAKALEIIHETGHFDLYRLRDWTAHDKLDNLLGYLRTARTILREAGGDPKDLKNLLYEWRRI